MAVSEGLYTVGGEFTLPDGTDYVGYYHNHPTEGAMVGAVHTNEPHERLTPVMTLRADDGSSGGGAINPNDVGVSGFIGDAQSHTNNGVTLAFSTKSNVWRSRYGFVPTCYSTLDNRMVTHMRPNVPNPSLLPGPHNYTSDSFSWHHDYGMNANLLEFYGGTQGSSIEVVSNYNPSSVKIFKSMSIEGDGVWGATTYTNVDRGAAPQQESGAIAFEEREGTLYGDIPASITEDTSDQSRELKFVGFVRAEDFFADETNVESINNGFDQIWTLPLVGTPKISLPTTGDTGLWFGRRFSDMGDMQFVSVIEIFPLAPPHAEPTTYSSHQSNVFNPYSYNAADNSISIISGIADSIALEGGFEFGLGLQYFVDYFLNTGIPGLEPIQDDFIPIFISQRVGKTGEMMRGPYMGARISGSGEIFAINVEFENTKLDGSLG